MNCPYCNKEIYAMTGLQELRKFQKHLIKCKKNPERTLLPPFVNEDGELEKSVNLTRCDMMHALEIRHNSGQ